MPRKVHYPPPIKLLDHFGLFQRFSIILSGDTLCLVSLDTLCLVSPKPDCTKPCHSRQFKLEEGWNRLLAKCSHKVKHIANYQSTKHTLLVSYLKSIQPKRYWEIISKSSLVVAAGRQTFVVMAKTECNLKYNYGLCARNSRKDLGSCLDYVIKLYYCCMNICSNS